MNEGEINNHTYKISDPLKKRPWESPAINKIFLFLRLSLNLFSNQDLHVYKVNINWHIV